MLQPSLLKIIFNKYFHFALLLALIAGIFLYSRFPFSFYNHFIEGISNFLKSKYGTGGSTEKIDIGLNKLGKLISFACFAIIIYLQFWKWLLNTIKIKYLLVSFENLFSIQLSRKDYIIIIVFFVIAILLRIFPITQSLWQDEIGMYEMFMQHGILSTIIPKSSLGSHPLMQIISTLFTDMFGVNEFNLRFPVFLISILTIPLLYCVCFTFTQQRSVAVVAVLLLTFHSYHIYYSFQMKGYSILVFLSLLSSYLLIKLLASPTKKLKLFYAITSVAIIYTHLFAIFFVIAQQLVLIVIVLVQKFKKTATSDFLSQQNLIEYFHSFLISILVAFLLYLPQLPVIFMNILADNSARVSVVDYFKEVITTSNFIVAYSNYALASDLYAVIISVLFLFYVPKNIVYRFIFFTGILLLLITGLLPINSGFYPRYLVCEIPVFVIIASIVIHQLWSSHNKAYRYSAIVLVLAFFSLSFISYPNTYKTIQNYRGAVDYVHNNSSNQKIIVANSLGKLEIQFYDKKIIPLKDVQELDSLINLHQDLYAITTYEDFAGRSGFVNDKVTQIKIEKDFKLLKTFDGEYPIHVWHYK